MKIIFKQLPAILIILIFTGLMIFVIWPDPEIEMSMKVLSSWIILSVDVFMFFWLKWHIKQNKK